MNPFFVLFYQGLNKRSLSECQTVSIMKTGTSYATPMAVLLFPIVYCLLSEECIPSGKSPDKDSVPVGTMPKSDSHSGALLSHTIPFVGREES